ncbi:cytochrome P450 4C1-like [Neodiprion virginianus]|uniref:cytochrome P450 4C1-like n=1 Tax=Neodiprion virginianus TaxID=2961670 RepID=UPI001EE6D19F|nr:cytochrome P450 4C1-like [Neodiprion virginianus]XP_046607279.1 cytochrome P450 4C1-like [Neodiprion virginianus]XP_046607280.1 cytochrome P450 4C1-like [Neodiprion virginianus]
MTAAVSISGFIVTSAILCGIISIVIYHLRRLRLYKQVSKFSGPPLLPFFGNALGFVGNTEDILMKIMELLNSYPSPFRVWLGHRLFFGVSNPEQMKRIFLSQKTIEKEDLYKFIRPWLGTGLFTAPASKWRVHRKLIMPTFNSRILESFVEVFAIQSKILNQQMEVELDGAEFDVFHYVSLCTLDIICETAMGVSVRAQTESSCRYVEATKSISSGIFRRMFQIWLHPDFIFERTQLGKTQKECVNYLHSLTEEVIQKKKKAYFQANGKPEKESRNGEFRRKAFLDLLMELTHNGEKFTDDELREEVDTMMLAGNDTTAIVNSFVMLMLASYPNVQNKVYEELYEIFGNDDNDERTVTHEDLPRMEYMERVIKETMRLFPIGPILVRAVTEDLDIGEHTLPAGSSVVLGILKAHRNEEFWPEPLKFDPDRFLPEEVAKRHPYCYVPFSAGPRNCLGIKYAMMAMKTLLSTVLRRYIIKKDDVQSIQDIKLKADLMLKPVKPITIRIEKRTTKINYI